MCIKVDQAKQLDEIKGMELVTPNHIKLLFDNNNPFAGIYRHLPTGLLEIVEPEEYVYTSITEEKMPFRILITKAMLNDKRDSMITGSILKERYLYEELAEWANKFIHEFLNY